jgi:type I restriction enzyme S subunit
MKDQQNFNQTEIAKTPKEWEFVRLGDGEICQIVMGQSPPSSTYNRMHEGLPFLQGNMDFGEIFPSPSIYCSNPIKIAEKDDVLISVRAPVGEVNISPSRVCIGRGLAAIRCKPDKTNDLFLFYCLKHMGKKLENISAGSTFKAIRKNGLDQLEILLPPLAEQKKIAEILTTVDQGIEKVNEAIKKTQRLKNGLMQTLLTKGIQKGKFKIQDFKETEIGRIPREWEIVRLRDISLEFIGGGTPFTSNPDFWNGNIAWMTSAHINGREIKNGQRYITEEGLKNSASSLVPKENLLVATRVGIGKAAINKVDIAISQDLTGIIIDKSKALPDFLYWVITNNEIRLKSVAQGSTIKGVLREELGRLKIPLPPISEQQKIAEILSTVDERLELLRKRKERLERVKKGSDE